MKEIFDWLREQIKESMVELIPLAVPRTERSYGKELAFTRSLAIVDEAEAKWEKDCCEWKQAYRSVYEAHGEHFVIGELKKWSVCPYCGKKIFTK